MKKLIIVIIIIAIFAGWQGAKYWQKGQIINAVFSCSDNKIIMAKFINDGKRSVDLKLSDGRKLSLSQVLSADGGRYANADESFVFWNKGDTAFITEGGTTTFADCLVKK